MHGRQVAPALSDKILLRSITELMIELRQAVRAVERSIYICCLCFKAGQLNWLITLDFDEQWDSWPCAQLLLAKSAVLTEGKSALLLTSSLIFPPDLTLPKILL